MKSVTSFLADATRELCYINECFYSGIYVNECFYSGIYVNECFYSGM